MARYEMNDEEIKNLFIFLNRVDFKGINEHAALSSIIRAISTPIVDETKADEAVKEENNQQA